jgi:peptide/nickel transport system substrate-binding protein
MSNRALLSASLLIVLLLSLASCRAPNPAPVATPPLNEGTPAPTPAPTKELSEVSPTEANPVPVETQAPSRQVGEGSAVIAFNQEFDQLNPLFAQALSAQMIYNVWNCQPWNFDDQNNPLPVLVQEIPSAENGGLSQDGRSITMKLRDDIVWSDGEPITSDDFVFTYQMITNPNNNVLDSSAYNGVESVTAPDPQTVVVQYKERNVSWIYALWHVLLPKHVLEPVFNDQGTLENAEWNKAPTVGCGPFVFDKWEAGQSVTFKTNEKYWLDLPHLGSILVKFYPDDASKAQAIISGNADLSVFLIDGATQIPIMQDAGMQILPVDSGYREGIFFFLDPTKGNPALQDVKVRQAIAMGIDRAAIITSLYKGVVQPAISYWDNTPYIDPSLKPWPYDPEKAKSLLEQAGWTDSNGNGLLDKDGLELKLSYGTTTSPLRQAVQAEIQKASASSC